MPAGKLYGHTVPRIFTPPRQPLEPRNADTERLTAGYGFIDLAELVGLDLYPWQRWLLIHALELNEDGSLRFATVVLLVSRQNGKSTLSQLLALGMLYVRSVQAVLGTAQRLDVAESIWAGAVDMAESSPELAREIKNIVYKNGQKSLVHKSGGEYMVRAASRKTRGLTADIVLLDELREHVTWEAYSALTKVTTARPEAQVWALSNAGDEQSIVLHFLRSAAHAALGDPDGWVAQHDPTALLDVAGQAELEAAAEGAVEVDEDTLAIFEWSARPDRALDDREGWAEANPALGYSITERTLKGFIRSDPEWTFRTESLCQWPPGALKSPFPPGAWDARKHTPKDGLPNQLQGQLTAGVGVSLSGEVSHVVLCGYNNRGEVQAEVAVSRAGKSWVSQWLTERVESGLINAITGQSRGTEEASILLDLANSGMPVIPLSGSELVNATTNLFDRVRQGSFIHLESPVMDAAAVSAAVKVLDGGARLIDDKRSPVDTSALRALLAALWVLDSPPPAAAKSAYESGAVEFV